MTSTVESRLSEGVEPAERRDGPWNIAIILVLLFGGIGLMSAAYSLVAGDWNFWTDWKDAVFWPLISAATAVFPLAAIQYIGWRLFRLPSATLLAVAFMIVWLAAQPLGFQGLTKYPANFTWPATVIPVAILLDVVLVHARGNWMVTALVGGFVFGALFYVANYYLIAPFLQPVVTEGRYLTFANLQGFELHRSATPEYLRRVSVGGLHTFAGQLSAITWLFTGAVCIVTYSLGIAAGRWFGVWPIERYLKRS
jgi:methane/ammonia monooxygenase subunit A